MRMATKSPLLRHHEVNRMKDKQRIEELERRVARLEWQIKALISDQDQDEPTMELKFDINTQIIELVRGKRKINAIKLYREETGADLKTAKNHIDTIEARIRRGEL